jgi:outer membrane protein assembly factor BamB
MAGFARSTAPAARSVVVQENHRVHERIGYRRRPRRRRQSRSDAARLDARTGVELWKQEYWGSWIESTAVFRDDRGYIGSGDLFLVSSFDPKTGKNIWRTTSMAG